MDIPRFLTVCVYIYHRNPRIRIVSYPIAKAMAFGIRMGKSQNLGTPVWGGVFYTQVLSFHRVLSYSRVSTVVSFQWRLPRKGRDLHIIEHIYRSHIWRSASKTRVGPIYVLALRKKNGVLIALDEENGGKILSFRMLRVVLGEHSLVTRPGGQLEILLGMGKAHRAEWCRGRNTRLRLSCQEGEPPWIDPRYSYAIR